MRAADLRGARRGRRFRTTRPDPAAVRPPDLVNRDFTAGRPNALWIVDFTYVATWSGMVFTAFVTDAFSRRIVGWRVAARMPTELPLDALEMALWTRERAGQEVDGVVHHSDAGVQGGFNWSSQHLDDGGVVRWRNADGRAPIERFGQRCGLRGDHRLGGRSNGSFGGASPGA